MSQINNSAGFKLRFIS